MEDGTGPIVARDDGSATVAGDVLALRRAERSVDEFVEAVCRRIEARDVAVRAFVDEPDRRARLHDEVAAAVERWPDPATRPPLFGVPVGLKDVVRADGMETRAGSSVPPAVLAGPEAALVTRLRAAGAVIAGKTVTAEFANFAPGPTRNPHHPDHTPGGSSSGSAAAVAAGMVPVGVGTQTVGSVIRPAAFCGVVGFKATHGRVPVDGVIAHSPSFDTMGTFTTDVATAAHVAPVLWDDWRGGTDDDTTPERAPVCAVPDGPFLDGADMVGRAAFASHRRRIEEAGFDVRDVPMLDDLAALTVASTVVNRYELAITHAPWFDAHRNAYRRRTATAILEGRAITADEYHEALATCRAFAGAIDALCDTLRIDLVLAPSAPGPAPRGLATTGDPRMNLPWTVAGRPALSLPAGTTGTGLPLGLQVVGRRGQDEALLAWGAQLEAALRGDHTADPDRIAPLPGIAPYVPPVG